jgi:hypothetical protein
LSCLKFRSFFHSVGNFSVNFWTYRVSFVIFVILENFSSYVFWSVNNMEVKCSFFLLSSPYKGSLRLHSKYLSPQYTIICCNPIPSFPICFAESADNMWSLTLRLFKETCLVTNISSQNISLHMTYCCSINLLLSSVSCPWPYRQRYTWQKVLSVKCSNLCCARVVHFIITPKAKPFNHVI